MGKMEVWWEREEGEGGCGGAAHCGDWFSDENSNLVITAHCHKQMGFGVGGSGGTLRKEGRGRELHSKRKKKNRYKLR